MKRVAALVPNVLGVSPGQRVRIETWAEYLRAAGWEVDFYPFEDERLHEVLYHPAPAHIKLARLASCYKDRLRLLKPSPPCDVLFIFREAALIGPAFIERMIRRPGVPIIYDFDDPVFLPYRSPMNGWFSLLKFPRKTHALFRLSDHIITINGLLAEYAARFNSSVSIVPNCVDIEKYFPSPRLDDGMVRLVWIGSHSTMQNLASIERALSGLNQNGQVSLRVIGAGDVSIEGIPIEVRQWSADTEVAQLRECDIGLLPLIDHTWHPWKFFFKAVQYMAVGLPVVARRMGSNAELIQDGKNGFLVDTDQEWRDRLQRLINDVALRKKMGEAARATIVERFSTKVQMPRVVSIFEDVLERARSRQRSISAVG
ncbi:MAG TPA: glycosyltransferase family 4 protein [Pyrinomonadaceae bacterium]|jgi:glycosyltransferase involved in cell wall biosynthesis|nr:glycosyltransferase family 4 protein [Pyrinomonadaceae bacterium]